MNRFHVIDDAVILRSRGVFRQAKVYRRGADVFAAWGSGYIRLLANSGTTVPYVSWDDLEAVDVTTDTPKGRPRYAV